MSQNSRRQFFKNILGLTGAALLAPALLSSTARADEKRKAKAADGDLELAVPGKDIAGSIGYVHKTTQPGKECVGCVLYTAAGKLKGDDVGKCAVIPGNKVVKAGGYCNSWAKKA